MDPEEIEFNRVLDADPQDQNARAAYADWLEDRGDPRAEGYRALAKLCRAPARQEPFNSSRWGRQFVWSFDWDDTKNWIRCLHRTRKGISKFFHLRRDGVTRLQRYDPGNHVLPKPWAVLAKDSGDYGYTVERRTRREAEDAAALGWAKLSPKLKARFLLESSRIPT